MTTEGTYTGVSWDPGADGMSDLLSLRLQEALKSACLTVLTAHGRSRRLHSCLLGDGELLTSHRPVILPGTSPTT
jgi:hypothetical protein